MPPPRRRRFATICRRTPTPSIRAPTEVLTDGPSRSTNPAARDVLGATGATARGAARNAIQHAGAARCNHRRYVVAFVIVYVLSLFGVHLLSKSAGPLKPPDLNATNDTIVLVRLEKLETMANRLTVKVLVIPEDSMFDKRLDVLKTDTAVRMDPPE
jgi:Domain of unknown function (DUF4436)